MPDTNPVPIKYIRTATMPKTPIGGKTDVFSVTDDGLAPQAPRLYTPAANEKIPAFGTWSGENENFTASYDNETGEVNIAKIGGSRNDYISTDLTRARFDPGYKSGSGWILVGATAGAGYGYDPSAGTITQVSRWSFGNPESGYPVVPSGTAFELEVGLNGFTVKYGGNTYTGDLSAKKIQYPTIGLVNVTTTTGSRKFTNLDKGSGTYSPDSTKFLRSDASWQNPPVNPAAFPAAFKAALLACFQNVAWVGDNGQQYLNALTALMAEESQSHDGWSNGVAYANVSTTAGQKVNGTSGAFADAEGWSRTGFIPCKDASRIVFPKLYETAMQANNAAFYNQAHQYVGGITMSLSAEKSVDVPSGAVYFAVSSETAALTQLLSDGIVPYA